MIQTSFEIEWAGEKWAWCRNLEFEQNFPPIWICHRQVWGVLQGSKWRREFPWVHFSCQSWFSSLIHLSPRALLLLRLAPIIIQSSPTTSCSSRALYVTSSLRHLLIWGSSKNRQTKWRDLNEQLLAKSTLTRQFWDTRPKPAYGRQGIGWDRGAMIQLRRVHFGVAMFWENLYFLRYSVSLTGGSNRPSGHSLRKCSFFVTHTFRH